LKSSKGQRVHEDSANDIAIVGVGCRFPGGITDLDSYWKLLAGRTSTVTGVPADRWDDRFHHASLENPGTSYCPRGSFLENVDRFDADFFGISPREAEEMDPQQRLLLEVSWAAMEDSGIPRNRWSGSRTGVYLGILAMDYTLLHAKTAGTGSISPYYASGKEFSFGAGRIAYTFGLHGPCVMLNTACSSSLMAVHLAVKALRSGECGAALAGGVNLMLTPELSIFMSKVRALSPSGICRPFDAAADGVVRSEGCGVIVLKRYVDAAVDGDRIWAVIHGSAANHDGRSAGLTAPNAAAQQDLLRVVLRDAGRSPRDMDFVEAHGTGTPLGDPLELSALAAVIGAEQCSDHPLYVGSHKANFGHMDSAAGIAGLLKAVLVTRHAAVPPQINLERPTPQIDWERSHLAIATELTPLRPRGERPLVGVSAFGLSGTNAHILLGPPPALPTTAGADAGTASLARSPAQSPAHGQLPVLPVSGHTVAALQAQVAAYRDRVRQAPQAELLDLVHTATTRRTHHAQRIAVVARTGEEQASLLDQYLAGHSSPAIVTGDVTERSSRPIVHAFSDRSSPWSGMGVDLYGTRPIFASTLDECDALFAERTGWSLLAELARLENSGRHEPGIAQPTIFAIQLGLSRLWSSWGLAPDVVVGHSMGEVAASVVAGTLNLPDAATLIVHRDRLLRQARNSGRMVAVELPAEQVQPVLERYDGQVCVAAVNGPTSIVIVGVTEAVEQASAELTANNARCLPLPMDCAVHWPAARRHGEDLARLLGTLTPNPPVITMLSSVDPQLDVPVTNAEYWGRHVTHSVQFWPAVDRLLAQHDAVFIEVGVHPVLDGPLRSALAHRGRTGPVVSSLSQGEPADLTLGRALAALHVAGVEVDWARVNGRQRRYAPLPPVPLGGDSYWLPGVERGRQGGARGLSEGLSADIRLFDAQGQLITELTATAGSAPAGSTAGAPTVRLAPERSVAVTAAMSAGPAGRTVAPATSAASRREQIAAVVSRICAEVLGHDPDRRISRAQGFFELGMDSLSLSDFVKALENHFEVELDAGAGINHPTIDQLSDHIAVLVAQRAGRAEVEKPVPVASWAPQALQRQPAPAAEPIAIVGMACRLPGADGLTEFWRLLTGGVDASGEIATDRFDGAALLARGAVTPGTIVTNRGCFLTQVDGFDHGFFRISAHEARSMDPQQRLFLEVAWEALDDAGIPATELPGSRVGLYVGLNTTDYMQMVTRNAADIDLYYGTGNSFCGTAGRLSYFLGVRGPSIAVDTACSSSLTAVHLACQALRAGEAALAITGGANVIINPTVYLAMSAAGALSPDGRCKTFSANADGYGRGEGAGAVVLKTLSSAQADGDRIYAILRGSAVNHNGASGGLTVPSAQAQEEVITDALERAGIDPADVNYVEAHGTGTRLGDGVELTALAAALGTGRPAHRPLLVGSVKTNIGHLEAAAGIAGLIKTVLALDHSTIPSHLHMREPNTQVDWDKLGVRVTTTPHPWSATSGRTRVAGVSAFGFTGTNAHVILTEAEPAPRPENSPGPRPYLLALSGASNAALRAAADRMHTHLAGATASLADVCYSAGARRTHLTHRLVAVARDAAELRGALAAYIVGTTGTGIHVGSALPREARPFAIGYGEEVMDLPWPQWDATEPAFTTALDALNVHTNQLLGRSARQALYSGAARHGDRVAVLAAQVALTALARAYGMHPAAVIGRGTGEIGAAYAAGLLELRETVQAVSGLWEVRLHGTPTTAIHLDSRAGGDLAHWTPPVAALRALWRTELIDAMIAEGIELVLDLGSGTEAVPAAATGTLRVIAVGTGLYSEDNPGEDLLAHAAAELHVHGCPVDWTALLNGARPVVSLPAYPWQRRRHWIHEAKPAEPAEATKPAEPDEAKPIKPAGTAGGGEEITPADAGGEVPPLVAELHALEPELRPDRMLTAVLADVATALGESSGADVAPDLGFFDLGVDSVIAIALMEQLGPQLGTKLEPTLTFEYPTSRALAEHLLDAVCGHKQPRTVTAPPPGSPQLPAEPADVSDVQADSEPKDDVADLSDDDLMNRLLDRISSSQALLSKVE
jgi:acyl transferase domain-containing protein